MSEPIRGEIDAVIVGAGFGGLYAIHKLRELGLTIQCFDKAGDVGGTWYWNRYPGCRCDIPSLSYSYTWSEELLAEWTWTEKYATQPEILEYARFVADRYDLRPLIKFETAVLSAVFDDQTNLWTVRTDRGDSVRARYLVMATGCLSMPRAPDIKGADTFEGRAYHTGLWPHEGVDFTGQRVAVIGTGASAVQAIPLIAQQAADLTVFQRTPNYILPARNGPVDPGVKRTRQGDYAGIWARVQSSNFGFELYLLDKGALESSDEEIERELMERWNQGGFGIWLGSYLDIFFSDEANAKVRKFLNERIREKVHDPETAELLTPKGYAFGCKRVPLDSGYYETFNLPRVHLVDVKTNPIAEITPAGLRLTDGTKCEFDAIVYATGFDAMTGPLNKIDIRGRDGRRLRDKWADGPRTYLGLMSAGYPNLFTITGPQSPSVLSNMPVSIEQHVEFIARIIGAVRDRGAQAIEPTSQAEDAWVAHNQEVAQASLFPTADTWYMGANIPGKPRVFMPYLGLVGPYRQKCDEIAAAGFEGFEFTGSTDKEGAPA